MSIATELTRIQTAKANIKAAIEAKGVSVPASATIDTYAALILEIPTSGSPTPPTPTGRTLTISDIPTPPVPIEVGYYPYVHINLDTPVDVEQGINTYMAFGVDYDYEDDGFIVTMTIDDGNGTPVTGYTTAYTNSALTISGPWGDDVTIGYDYSDGDINCEQVPPTGTPIYETFSGDTMTVAFPALEVNGECQCGKDGGDWDYDNNVCLHDAALIIEVSSIPNDGQQHEYKVINGDSEVISILTIDTSDWSYTYEDNPDGAISHDITTAGFEDNEDLSAGWFRWTLTGFFYGSVELTLDSNSLMSDPLDYDGSTMAEYVLWDGNDVSVDDYSCYDEWDCVTNNPGCSWNAQDGTCDCE